jgi:hypothetical protein
MESQTAQQTVVDSQTLDRFKDEIQQEMSQVLKNSNLSKILEKYDISAEKVLKFQCSIDLDQTKSLDTNPSLTIPGNHIVLKDCWSVQLQTWVPCG